LMAGINKLGKAGKTRVDQMIELTGLTREAHKVIGTLSKGYRQRVGLAQALLHDPEVLILDEPTSGLDPNQIVEIRNLIRGIAKEKTVLLSTHVMQEVEAICDKVIIINLGKIVADAPTKQVQLLTQTTRIVKVAFDKSANINEISKLEGVEDVEKFGDFGFKVFSKGEIDLRPKIFNFAVENGLVILMMDLEEKSLEDVFRQLTL
jgi:ABC-2 type transport system ATP-binding protein